MTEVTCAACESAVMRKESHAKRHARFFCNLKCRSDFVKRQPFWEQPSYKGVRQPGESKQLYHRRYVASHPETISHLKAKRYARERGAHGEHSQAEWDALKAEYRNRCAFCYQRTALTRDHVVPLSLGGNNRIQNIQPLCRSCNSRKWATPPIHQNPDLLTN